MRERRGECKQTGSDRQKEVQGEKGKLDFNIFEQEQQKQRFCLQ